MFGTPPEGFAVPLVARGQRLGTLAVGRHLRHRHDADEVAVLEDVARRAALAIDNARIHDERRKVARTLQAVAAAAGAAARRRASASPPSTCRPAREVGGDFYDVVPLGDDRWLVVVGDVSGKGVQAATVTGLVRDVIRILVDDGKPMTEILCRVNRTLVAARRRPLLHAGDGVGRPGGRTARSTVCLHLAGHDRAVLVRADGKTSFVGEGGTALGLLETISSPDADGDAAAGRLADLLHRRGDRTAARPRAVRHRPAARGGGARWPATRRT